MSKPATLVLWAATVYAYRVTVYDEDVQPLEEYTGGNSRFDSAAFVDPEQGESLETMQRYARITAGEMAAKWGLEPSQVDEDTDEADALTEAYGPREAAG